MFRSMASKVVWVGSTTLVPFDYRGFVAQVLDLFAYFDLQLHLDLLRIFVRPSGRLRVDDGADLKGLAWGDLAPYPLVVDVRDARFGPPAPNRYGRLE